MKEIPEKKLKYKETCVWSLKQVFTTVHCNMLYASKAHKENLIIFFNKLVSVVEITVCYSIFWYTSVKINAYHNSTLNHG